MARSIKKSNPQDKPQSTTIAAYAKSRGVSRQKIENRIKRGLIPRNPDGTIDPALADASEHAVQPHADPHISQGFATARAVREGFMAKLARLEFERESGKLVDLKEVTDATLHMITITKSRLRGIGNRLAPQLLAVEQDAAIFQTMIDTEIDEALAELSRYRPRDPTDTTV